MTDTVASWHLGIARSSAVVEKAEAKIRAANFATHLFWESRRVVLPRCRGRAEPKDVWIRKPLFDQYLFVGCREGQSLYDLKDVYELLGFRRDSRGPLVVPHRVIDALTGAVGTDGITRLTDTVKERKRFKGGDIVEYDEINSFSRVLYVVEKHEGDIVQAFTNFLGTETRFSLPAEKLRPYNGYVPPEDLRIRT